MPTNEPTKAMPKKRSFLRSSDYTHRLVVIDLDVSHGDSPSPQWAQLGVTHCGDVLPAPHHPFPVVLGTMLR
jgi:hypothetical protein